jgi:hypothetical protein
MLQRIIFSPNYDHLALKEPASGVRSFSDVQTKLYSPSICGDGGAAREDRENHLLSLFIR